MGTGSVAFSDKKYSNGKEKLQPFKLKMLRLASEACHGRILDIGCGTGVMSQMLKQSGFEVIGIDISNKGLKKCYQAGFDCLLSDAERNLPFKNDSFSAVWISEVIEHIVNYENLLEEVGRVLRTGGRIYLTTPNSVFYGYRLKYLLGKCPTELQHPYHLRFFSYSFLQETLQKKGFIIENSLGQNIYFYIACPIIENFNVSVSKLIKKLIDLIGFTKVEGLIHGEKYLFFKFSSLFNRFFSNVIMIVARRI